MMCQIKSDWHWERATKPLELNSLKPIIFQTFNDARLRRMAKSAYLLVYNLFCCSVWAWLLFQAITVESDQLWHAIELQLKAIQTLAILEVFHALVGLVRSPVPTTVIQGKQSINMHDLVFTSQLISGCTIVLCLGCREYFSLGSNPLGISTHDRKLGSR